MKFNERLRFLRKETGKEIKKVAEDCNISRDILSKYELGRCEPSLEVLVILANYYHVSLDYLIRGDELGIFISKEEYKELKNAKIAFDKIVKSLNRIEERQALLERKREEDNK